MASMPNGYENCSESKRLVELMSVGTAWVMAGEATFNLIPFSLIPIHYFLFNLI